MPFLPPNQQRQSTEGTLHVSKYTTTTTATATATATSTTTTTLCLKKNHTDVAQNNFNAHQPILVSFGYWMVICYPTSLN